jgi:hypothetical protein
MLPKEHQALVLLFGFLLSSYLASCRQNLAFFIATNGLNLWNNTLCEDAVIVMASDGPNVV